MLPGTLNTSIAPHSLRLSRLQVSDIPASVTSSADSNTKTAALLTSTSTWPPDSSDTMAANLITSASSPTSTWQHPREILSACSCRHTCLHIPPHPQSLTNGLITILQRCCAFYTANARRLLPAGEEVGRTCNRWIVQPSNRTFFVLPPAPPLLGLMAMSATNTLEHPSSQSRITMPSPMPFAPPVAFEFLSMHGGWGIDLHKQDDGCQGPYHSLHMSRL